MVCFNNIAALLNDAANLSMAHDLFGAARTACEPIHTRFASLLEKIQT
jgi:hypothetical protein